MYNPAMKEALLGAGVKKPERTPKPVVQRAPNKAAYHGPKKSNGPAKAPPKDGYIVLPFHKLRDGSRFTPIEKMGKRFYYKTRDPKTHRVTYHGERHWAITKDIFIKDSNARSMSLTTGKDAIFSLHDWCIVKVG